MRLDRKFRDVFLHFWHVFYLHTLFVALVLTYVFVLNGLTAREERRLGILKEHYSLVKTEVDKRRGNIFQSTPDYFLKLSELVPEVEAVLEGSPVVVSFTDRQSGKTSSVERELPIYFVSGGYFDAFNGRFIQGRGFTKNEVFTGQPLVVLTEGALEKIFGDSQNALSQIWINGIAFQVVGTWAFDVKEIDENAGVFLPIGITQLFGKYKSTYVNNFILRDGNSETVSKIKRAIDKLQLDSGRTPERPEFRFELPRFSRKTEIMLIRNKIYLDAMLWLVLFSLFIASYRSNSTWLSFRQNWAVWKFMQQGDMQDHAETGTDDWLKVMTFSLASGAIISVLALAFLKYMVKFDIGLGRILHPALYLYPFMLAFQFAINKYWAKQLRYTLPDSLSKG